MKALIERGTVNSFFLSKRTAIVLSTCLVSGSGFHLPVHSTLLLPKRPPSRILASRNSDDALTNAAPIFITVGPQCCGKSTFLREQHPRVIDISLDDQLDVHIPIKTSTFLNANNTASNGDDMQCLDEILHGKTLKHRILHDNTELTLILRHWNGELSPKNFSIDLLQLYHDNGQPVKVAESLIRAIQETKYKLPDEIQVFVVESLFRPHPTDDLSAIGRAYKRLRTTPSHIAVAWGNTNSKPKDYQMVLEIACQTRRPVHIFLATPDGPLASPSLSVLLARNLQRLSESGKYVPAVYIAECLQRVNGLFDQISDMDPFAKEQYIVHLAEPPIHRNNNNNNKSTSTYRYRLTRNRLIQKEFLAPGSTANQARQSTTSYPSVLRPTHSQYIDSTKLPNHMSSASSWRWNQAQRPQQQQRSGPRNFENDRRDPTDRKRQRTNQYPDQHSSSQNSNTTRMPQ